MNDQQTTEQLFREAIQAVNALTVHLEQIGDTDRMYKANQAYRKLWDAQRCPAMPNLKVCI